MKFCFVKVANIYRQTYISMFYRRDVFSELCETMAQGENYDTPSQNELTNHGLLIFCANHYIM